MDLQEKHQRWLATFSQQKNSNLSIIDFCRQHKINVSTFYLWRKKLSQNSDEKSPPVDKQQLIPLMVSDSAFTAVPSLTITTPNGYQLNFNERLSPENLAAFLTVLP